MGCWNGTCGITQLPILPGDAVQMIAIAPAGYNSLTPDGTSYYYELYQPVCLPVRGKYDYYGWIENEQDGLGNRILTSVIPDIWDAKVDRRESFEQQGWLYVLVLESIYQTCVAMGDRLRQKVIKKTLAAQDAYRQRDYELISEYDISGKLREAMMSLSFSAGVNYTTGFSHDLQRFILQSISTMTRDEVEEYADFVAFCAAMGALRRQFVPQSGQGSQRDELEPYKMLMEAENRIIAAREAEMLEDEDWDDEGE